MRARSSRPIALFCADRDRKGTEVKGPRPEKGRWAPVCVCVGVAAPTLDLGYCYRRMSREKVRSRGRDLHFFTKRVVPPLRGSSQFPTLPRALVEAAATRLDQMALISRGLRPGLTSPPPLRGSVSGSSYACRIKRMCRAGASNARAQPLN